MSAQNNNPKRNSLHINIDDGFFCTGWNYEAYL